MVGGKVFLEHPELAALVGADATAYDARQACAQAESLLALLTARG
jgi:methanogenic corrinoid protein MtbC1